MAPVIAQSPRPAFPQESGPRRWRSTAHASGSRPKSSANPPRHERRHDEQRERLSYHRLEANLARGAEAGYYSSPLEREAVRAVTPIAVAAPRSARRTITRLGSRDGLYF